MYNNNVIVLFNILKNYNEEIYKIIVSSDVEDDKEFSSEDLSILIENIMCDLKDLNRNI
jgi:hypothetical protein